MHLHIWWILPRSLYLGRLQSCAMGTSEHWSHDVDPMWWWVTLPETESPALEFSGAMLVSERVVALWSRGFLNDKLPGCLSSKKAATTYVHLWFVGPNCPMASFHQLRLWSQWFRCLWRLFSSFAKKGEWDLKGRSSFFYWKIATTSKMLLAVSTPVCPCREAKNHSTCSPETNGYKLEQNPIAIGYSTWFRTWKNSCTTWDV